MAYHNRGTSVRGNGLAMRIERIDNTVLAGTRNGERRRGTICPLDRL